MKVHGSKGAGMLRVLLLSAVLVVSCTAPRTVRDSGAGYLTSGSGTLAVTGVSSRMRNAEREIDSALDDAARQIALYHGLKGKVVTILETGTGYRDFYLAVETELTPLDEDGYAKYREALHFDREKDLVRTESAVFLRCVYDVIGVPGLPAAPAPYKTGNGEPAWLHGPVEIPGYISAVGFAKNRRFLKETITGSRESAAAALLAVVSSRIETIVTNRTETTREIIEGELLNFIVLEIWIDQADGSVWTLAAAKNMQKETP
jgi:hypothetical protein